MKIFDIDEQDFLNPEKVKIIDGIAGAGKSSAMFMFAEAGADAEQMKILTEAKMKILAGLEEQKKGDE